MALKNFNPVTPSLRGTVLISVFTPVTLTPNNPSTAALISGFLASIATRNTNWPRSLRIVAFSVTTGLRMMLYIASRDSCGLRLAGCFVSLMTRLPQQRHRQDALSNLRSPQW